MSVPRKGEFNHKPMPLRPGSQVVQRYRLAHHYPPRRGKVLSILKGIIRIKWDDTREPAAYRLAEIGGHCITRDL